MRPQIFWTPAPPDCLDDARRRKSRRSPRRFGVSVGRMSSKIKPRARAAAAAARPSPMSPTGRRRRHHRVAGAARAGARVARICAARSRPRSKTLGYVPDTNARALASARANVVGVLVPSLTNNVFADVVRGIYDGLSDTDFQIQIGNTHYSGMEEERLLQGVPRPAAGGADRVGHRPDAGGAAAARERRLPGGADHGDRRPIRST